MAFQTNAQADTYYTTKAVKPFGWDDLSNTQKDIYLESASNRFLALPWQTSFEGQANIIANASLLGAFYQFLNYLVKNEGKLENIFGDTKEPEELNALSDLPSNVASIVLPFLEPSKLSIDLSGDASSLSVRIGDTVLNLSLIHI